MRDFRAGRDISVEGDVHIVDNLTQPKLLVVCANEEFFAERIHRTEFLKQERKAIWKRLATAWLSGAIMLGVSSLWFYFQGNTNLSGLVLGLGSLAAGFASVKVLERPNEFEARQIAALN